MGDLQISYYRTTRQSLVEIGEDLESLLIYWGMLFERLGSAQRL